MIDNERKKLEEFIRSGLALAKKEEGAKNALAFLFPKVEQAIITYMPSSSDVNMQRIKRRVSISDFAEHYFALAPELNSWGRSEFESVFKKGPLEAFTALRKKIQIASPEDQSDLRRIFIELLDAEFGSRTEIDHEWLQAIVREGPFFIAAKDEEAKFLFHFENQDRLRWLLQHALARIPTEQRVALVKSAISDASDLVLLADIIRVTAGDLNPAGGKKEGGSSSCDFGDETESIRGLLVDRIDALAEHGELWNQTKPDQLLWFWWGANQGAEVKEFTSRAMNTREGLLALLQTAPQLVRSSQENYERVSPSWKEIVDLDKLNEKAEQLLKDGSEEDAAVARRFITALQTGKSDRF